MTPYRFSEKLLESERADIRVILQDELYPMLFPCLTSIEYVKDITVQRSGSDLMVRIRKPHGSDSIVYHCEEKIREPKYWAYRDDILLETHSNHERRTSGWTFTSESDFLIYVWQNLPEMRVFVCPMRPLVQWFSLNHHWFKEKIAHTSVRPGVMYTTLNRVVPLLDRKFRGFCIANGSRLLLRDVDGQWRDE
jgi:hypothetical protein